jgi:hypothetical protein
MLFDLRVQVFESGVLAFLLGHLSELCDIMPRAPEHKDFALVVKRMKEKQRERQEQLAKQQNTSTSGSDGKYWAKVILFTDFKCLIFFFVIYSPLTDLWTTI